MIKKSKEGFTLAEVLITLAIIGVVASITLPALISNAAEQQAITAYRKAMNTLNEVAQMSAAEDGFDYSGISAKQTPSASAKTLDKNGVVYQTLWAMMVNRANVDKTMSGKGVIKTGVCKDRKQIFFMDGTVLCYVDRATATDSKKRIAAVIDVNGFKGPNELSTCKDETCKKRAIKDQFYVSLYGSSALPGTVDITDNGDFEDHSSSLTIKRRYYASRWALRK